MAIAGLPILFIGVAGLVLGLLVASASGAGSGEPLFHDSGTVIFNFVAVGTTSQPQTVTISNAGEGELEITGVAVSNSKDFSVSTDECTGESLGANQTCTVSVVFHPYEVGTRFGSLEITTTRSACKNYVAMAGSGTKAQAPTTANAADCVVPGPPVPGKTVIVPGQNTTTEVPGGTGSAATESDVLQFVAPPKCVLSGHRIRLDLHTSKADEIVAARVYINGHLDNVARYPNITTVVTRLPHNRLRRYRVQVVAGIATGGTLGLTRYFYVCRSSGSR